MSYETYENVLIYYISYKTSTGAKPLHSRCDKIDGFIKIHDRLRYLVFDYGRFDKLYERIKYLIIEKSGTKVSINHNLGRMRIDQYNSLPIRKISTFHSVIILIKSVVNTEWILL